MEGIEIVEINGNGPILFISRKMKFIAVPFMGRRIIISKFEALAKNNHKIRTNFIAVGFSQRIIIKIKMALAKLKICHM